MILYGDVQTIASILNEVDERGRDASRRDGNTYGQVDLDLVILCSDRLELAQGKMVPEALLH